jgi:hypothetical protein
MSNQKRNAPCDCGSGRKYKHCHGKLTSPTDDSRPPTDALEFMRRQMDSINAAEYRRRLMHGLGRPIISFEANGFRIVAVGMDLRWSKGWKTFADFLMDYIKTSLTSQWGNPDTFFDIVKPINKPLTKPLELFDFFARSYMDAKKETLLDWMKEHPDIDSLTTKSQKEVAEIYCDRMATAVWHRGTQSEATNLSESVADRAPEVIEIKIGR